MRGLRASAIRIGLLALGASSLGPAPALALDPAKPLREYGLDIWQARDGLPQNSVFAISQSRQGYLWLGTQEGLVRFDGVRFTVFDKKNAPQMRNTFIQAILESGDGSLWIGTDGGGLLRLRDGAFHALTAKDGLGSDSVTDLAEDRAGRLWIATAGGGVVERGDDGRLRAITTREGLPSDQVKALCVDQEGALWIGSDGGLSRLAAGQLRRFGVEDGVAPGSVTALAEGRDGSLWIGSQRGLQRRSRTGLVEQVTFSGLPDQFIRALYVDRAGTLWVGTSRGVARLRGKGFEAFTVRDGLSWDIVVALFEDREGSLWIGTTGGGLNRLKEASIATYPIHEGARVQAVYTVAGDGKEGLWAGAVNGTVHHLRDGRFEPASLGDPLTLGPVRSLYQDPRGGLWIGTDRGLFHHTGRGPAVRAGRDALPDHPVRAIVRDAEDDLWIASDGGGLIRMRPGRIERYTTARGMPSDRVRALLPSRQGGLWIGSHGGLSRFRQERFEHFTVQQGLAAGIVRCLYEDAEGTLWIGTFGGGLNRLTGGKLTCYRVEDGLFSDTIHQILEDDRGNLWMSSNKGIFRVSKRELLAHDAGRPRVVRSIVYDESDGMRARECNAGGPAGWKTADGRLWFASMGVAMVDPLNLKASPAAPPVILEGVIVDDAVLPPDRPAELRPGARRLEFRYTGFDFGDPHGLRFRYKLDGFDPDWIEAGARRVAFYTQLRPGDYRFRVGAAGAEGPWNDTEATFTFQLRPHFFQTRWFRLTSLAAVLGSGFAAHRLRLARLKAQKRRLEARVEEELARAKVLRGLLPICAWCKKVRDDRGYWEQIETYIHDRSEADFSHGICPDCRDNLR